jgi:hypothetical protein
MGTLFKVLIIGLIILGLIAAAELAIMAGVADTQDVKRIPVPKESTLFQCRRCGILGCVPPARGIQLVPRPQTARPKMSVSGRGEARRTSNEVVAGHVPGMDYTFSYRLDRADSRPLSAGDLLPPQERAGTLVEDLRPIQRCLAPYMLDKLGERAPG